MKTQNSHHPPRIPKRLLLGMKKYQEDFLLAGDLEEVFTDLAKAKSDRYARLWFWFQVLGCLPKYLMTLLLWRFIMLKDYLKIAFRRMKKEKAFSFINIFGLAVGMTCAMLILIYVRHEMSYDRFHPDADRIYQVLSHTDVNNWSISPTPLGPALKEEFPEIVESTRYHWIWGGATVSHENRSFNIDRMRFGDPSFFRLFDFPFLQGDPETALIDPNSIVITQTMAEKYFGEEDALGQTLTLNQDYPLSVTGIVENFPPNSTIRFDMLAPIEFNMQNLVDHVNYDTWNNIIVVTYIECRDNVDADALTDKIVEFVNTHRERGTLTFTLLPLTDRHFFFTSGRASVYAFFSVSVFILLIACFNFMNLAIARSARRIKEIGMRKIVGAYRRQIIGQFLGESILIAVISGVFAAGLFFVLFPVFETIIGKSLVMRTTFVALCFTAVALFTGLVSGSYPALVLSRVRLIQSLKGRSESDSGGGRLRKAMVVFQFIISTLLLIGMLVVREQRHFIQNKDVGYGKECLVGIPMGGGSKQFYQRFKQELLKGAGIRGVTGTAVALPFFNYIQGAMVWEGKKPDIQQSVNYNAVDYDFIETIQADLLEGRAFSREFPSDIGKGYLINETMSDLIGIDPVVGTQLGWEDNMGRIVGVIEDFHFESMNNHIGPLVIQLNPDIVDNVLVRVRPDNMATSLSFIEKTWKTVIPGYPFEYAFLDDEFEQSMFTLVRTGRLISAFCILAVIISCLGLFGLSSFTAEQRTKEIGVRKVLGASTVNIVRQIFREFSVLIVIANVVVWPIAYFIMNNWLQAFAYRVQIGWWIFLTASALALLVSLLSVSWQTIRAARANPVESLRYE